MLEHRKKKRSKSEIHSRDSNVQEAQRKQWWEHQHDGERNDEAAESRKRTGRESWTTAAPKMPKGHNFE